MASGSDGATSRNAARIISPFFGRADELRVLRETLEKARGGSGRAVLIEGEAGLGKSRLVGELRRSLPEDVAWIEGRCLPNAEKVPYFSIVQIVRSALVIPDGVSGAAVAAHLERVSACWDEPARATVPYFQWLLDAADEELAVLDPVERKVGLFDGLRTLLGQLSRGRTLVVAVEDLHWIDESSEAALAAVMEGAAFQSVMILATFRPGYRAPFVEAPTTIAIRLARLGDADSAAFAGALLADAPLPDNVRPLLLARAAGNPFFFEEAVRYLVETAIAARGEALHQSDTAHLPDKVEQLLVSRIEQLDPNAREAIQLASVIGTEFAVSLLERIWDRRPAAAGLLAELERSGLLRFAGEGEAGTFRHALTQQAAYSTTIADRRKALHGAVARAMEELHKDRLGDHYEVLADHYVAAECWPEALGYLTRAANKAAAGSANRTARQYFDRALAVAERVPDAGANQMPALLQGRAFVRLALGDGTGALEDLQRLRDVARQIGDRHTEAAALIHRALCLNFTHDFDTAENEVRAALAIAEESRFDDLRADANVGLSALMNHLGRHREADRALEHVVRAFDQIADPMTRAFGAFWAMHRPSLQGRYAEAMQAARRWRVMVETSGLASFKNVCRWGTALIMGGRGDYDEALAVLEDVRDSCERLGDGLMRGRCLNTLGWIHGELQNHRHAIELNSEALLLAESAGDPEVVNNTRLNLGDSLFAEERLDEADAAYEAVERMVRHPRQEERMMLWRYSQHLFASRSELALARGDVPRALAYAGECLELAEPSASRKYVAKARRLRGLAMLANGELQPAADELNRALAVAREISNPPQLWRTLAALGEYHRVQDDGERARGFNREALVVIDAVAAGLGDLHLRETFLGSPHVREIRRAAETQETQGQQFTSGAEESTVFRRSGDGWAIGFPGRVFHLRDAVGLRYLRILVASPGREFVAGDLASESSGEPVAGVDEPDLHCETGDSGPALDSRAKQEYRLRLDDLRDELEEARRFNDSGRAERASAEIEAISTALGRAVGLAGRDRPLDAALERTRLRVTRAIRRSIEKIGEESRDLGEHLQRSVTTGAYCCYRPEPRSRIRWAL